MPFAIALSSAAQALLDRAAAAPETAALDIAPVPMRVAVEAALDRGETHYTDRPGILHLREKIAALLYDRFQIYSDAESDIIVTCGSTEARFVATQTLLRPGDILAAPISHELLFGLAGLRRAELADSIMPSARLVYLKSSTAEPILRSDLALVPDHALILFEVDELTSRFHPAQITNFKNRTITIGDLGGESWRMGYLASPGGASADLRDFKQALTICSTNLSQWAMLAALEAL